MGLNQGEAVLLSGSSREVPRGHLAPAPLCLQSQQRAARLLCPSSFCIHCPVSLIGLVVMWEHPDDPGETSHRGVSQLAALIPWPLECHESQRLQIPGPGHGHSGKHPSARHRPPDLYGDVSQVPLSPGLPTNSSWMKRLGRIRVDLFLARP